jgi:hypothetical protein
MAGFAKRLIDELPRSPMATEVLLSEQEVL